MAVTPASADNAIWGSGGLTYSHLHVSKADKIKYENHMYNRLFHQKQLMHLLSLLKEYHAYLKKHAQSPEKKGRGCKTLHYI